ncbi:GlxA family transcriptional regulator [Coralliovum pocilloporae]|uniref:GlxA family transcriptional regulator n=1 Tax=Coralliovum pocilloporae TaxID=3066369 RepID=UPI0033072166
MTHADSTPTEPPQLHHVHFVLVNQFSLVAFGMAVDALRMANKSVGREVFRWQFYSPDGSPVEASNGLMIHDVQPFSAIGDKGLVLICAGDGVEHQTLTSGFLSGINTLHRHGHTIIGICTGAYILARAGLLNNRQCTIHWEYRPLMEEQFPDIEVLDQIYLFDKTICTCSGGTAPFELMLDYATSLLGPQVATAIADIAIYRGGRSPSEPQRAGVGERLNVANAKLIKAIEIMETRLEDVVQCEDIAEAVGVSLRQLERLFKTYVNQTPNRYYLELRLARARDLILKSRISISEICLSCGFSSPSHFSKCYKDQYGITPSEARRHGRGILDLG